jgi:hypothetical protein
MSQIFPKWANRVPKRLIIGSIVLLNVIIFGVWYFFSPRYLDVGYQPIQPIPYSHAIHAGKLGIDCRYCHTSVEKSPHANIPPTQTCMNCHSQINSKKPKQIAKIRDHWKTGKPIQWIRVHKLPEYVNFNHSAHINAGVGCVTCHGRVDKMQVVHQVEPLNMAWCINCHRNPAPHLRPVSQVTNMNWKAPNGNPEAYGKKIMAARNIHAPTYCDGCHY